MPRDHVELTQTRLLPWERGVPGQGFENVEAKVPGRGPDSGACCWRPDSW